MPIMYQHPLMLPARYTRPIGDICAGWVLVELNVQALTWHCSGLGPKEGRTLTYGLSADKKLALLKAMELRWLPPQVPPTELAGIHKEADRLRGRRNLVVHGLWGHPPGKRSELSVFVIRTQEDKVLPRRERLTPADLALIARQIRALNVKLRRLLRRIGAPRP